MSSSSSSSSLSTSSTSSESEKITMFSDRALQQLTKPDPSNRESVGDSPADLHTLAQLVIQGDFGKVRRLATRQLVTSADADRRTVLMLVADAPETPVHTEKCILYLFELGAIPKAADANGNTAAHLAARRDHLRLLTLLSFDAKWLRNDNGATPLMEAARTGSWKCAKHLLHLLRQDRFNECRQHRNSKRSRLLRLKDLEDWTASALARLSGHSELASYIKREMRLVVDEYGTISGLTAQEEADRQKLQRLVNARDLAGLRRAATRDSCDLPDFLGLTALMGVAQLNAEDRMKLVEMDAYDRRGYIAMNEAWRSDEALWKQLVELGDPTCANTAADSCLHHAVKDGNSAAASALLAAGASANARNQCEYTPLIQAVTCWAPQHVSQVLLDSGADWSLKNNKYRTALALATQKRNWRLAELLRGYEGKVYFNEPLALPRKIVTDHSEEPRDDTAEEADPNFSGAMRAKIVRHQPPRLEGDFYPVTDPQGYCLIINISKYESGSDITFSITERKGSDRDVEQAKRVFERLRFIVKIKKDLTTEQLDDFLSEIKKSRDLAKHGSFVCFLMAHGSHDCIYGRDGCPYEIRKVTERFQTSVCRSLEGKPKVFFIQAGRGSRQDRTFASYSREESRYNLTVCTPESDFMVCYANSPGSVAFRSINTGSLYVQTVCDFIEKNFRELDLSTIMTNVSDHLQRNPVWMRNSLYRVVPQKVDQLSRQVSFDPERAHKLRGF
ncbi:hypothetical protein BOX15_Mlig016858g2 [Macrostomum lignano]|uniref:ANK_REP_REGION domain-containing protein n=1 Tax=Macrostomum lignano TaxID=282301 RepID=A0A267DQD1_9PLAT|nr:hypothetical protein BOX15_Mlig016858g2 [Macrostomum lignano]